MKQVEFRKIDYSDAKSLLHNCSVVLSLFDEMKECNFTKIRKSTWEFLCDSINDLAELATEMYFELHPEEEEDEDLC